MNVIKMNKKANLLSTVVGLVIGVLCVIILAGIAIGLYNQFIKPGINEQAKATFAELNTKIESLDEGDQTSFIYLNPDYWVLIQKDRTFCFCSTESISDFSEGGDKSDEKFFLCSQQKQKLCHDFDFDVSIDFLCTFDTTYAKDCLRFYSGIKRLTLYKENGVVKITTPNNFQTNNELNTLLNLKNSNGNTVNDLLLELARLNTNPAINTPLRQELNTIVTNYFNSYDSFSKWNVNKKDFYFLFRLEIQGENIGGSLLYIGDDGGITISNSIKNFNVNGKDYLITLNYYNDPDRLLRNINI